MRLSRRQFLGGATTAVVDAWWIEPGWLKIRRLDLRQGRQSSCRLVFFTDLHFKGDVPILEKLVATINRQRADFVCFSGDLVEDNEHLQECLKRLGEIECPLYVGSGVGWFFLPVRFRCRPEIVDIEC